MEFFNALLESTLVSFAIAIFPAILFHELGHFLVGKWLGIAIEDFSIGFGPKAFSFRFWGTDFRLNWIPLGGYVRFSGMTSTDAPLPALQKPIPNGLRLLEKASPFEKILIYLAGPLASFLLGFLIVLGLSLKGTPVPAPIIGVAQGSAAAEGGLRDGDTLLQIESTPIRSWVDIAPMVQGHAGQPLQIRVRRAGTGHEETLTVTPREVETQEMGEKVKVGRLGVTAQMRSPRLSIAPGEFLSVLGFQSGDTLETVDGKPVESMGGFLNLWKAHWGSQGPKEFQQLFSSPTAPTPPRPLTLTLRRESAPNRPPLSTTLTVDPWSEPLQSALAAWTGPLEGSWEENIHGWDTTVVPQDSTSTQAPLSEAQCPLHVGDRLMVMGEWPIQSFADITSIWSRFQDIPSHLTDSWPLTLKVFRPADAVSQTPASVLSFECRLPIRASKDAFDREVRQVHFPYSFGRMEGQEAPHVVVRAESWGDALQRSSRQFWDQLTMMGKMLRKLFTRELPLSNLGGPIAIGMVAQKVAKEGFLSLMALLSLISTQLGLVNLLPLPIFDGGNILIHFVSLLRGRPLPERWQTHLQTLGVLLVIGLFLLSTYNDVMRLISKGH